MLLVQWDVTLMDVITNSRWAAGRQEGKARALGRAGIYHTPAEWHGRCRLWHRAPQRTRCRLTYKMDLALPC